MGPVWEWGNHILYFLVFQIPSLLTLHQWGLYVHMPTQRHTRSHTGTIWCWAKAFHIQNANYPVICSMCIFFLIKKIYFLLCVDDVCGFRNLSRREKESLEMKRGNRGKGERREPSGKERSCSFSGSITSCGRSVLLCCIWGWGCHATVLA